MQWLPTLGLRLGFRLDALARVFAILVLGIVALAGIITMTPGTLSAELSPDHRHLLIHAFNVDDEAALIATIQSRYDAPLMEIFA